MKKDIKKNVKKEGKKPFFAKFLENQMNGKETNKIIGAATQKSPSDKDESDIIDILKG